ncbi:hypothetical protein JB92DRAFT_2960180 [Gautieria morchelliformis]|nr:hypothetical protein JB92DRAFT_3014669 [Gautieria morchelliformis]KAF8507505.1 hypothetical protein JB92DRAFT_2960180 [Gautieria morchelliformis]
MHPFQSSIASDELNFILDEHAPWLTNDVNHSHTANDTPPYLTFFLPDIGSSGFSAGQDIFAPSLDKEDSAEELTGIEDNSNIYSSDSSQASGQLGPNIPPAVTSGHPQHIYMPVGTITKTPELKEYITTTKVEGQTRYRCNYPSCSHQGHFDTRREAISHIRRIHLNGKSFAQKQDAIRHVNAKTRGKIFECTICHERYARKDYRDVHARRCLTKSKQVK